MLESQNIGIREKSEFNKITCEKQLSKYLALMFEDSMKLPKRNETFEIQNLKVLTSTWNEVPFWDEEFISIVFFQDIWQYFKSKLLFFRIVTV